MPTLPDHFPFIDEATPERPFRLVAAPARTFLNSTFSETPGSRAREVRPTALLHPEDCAALGVAEGDRVALGNERGSVIVHFRPRRGQQRDVVIVEGIWPNRDFEGGIGINALTSAEPGYPNGGAVFHDTACQGRSAMSGKHRSKMSPVRRGSCPLTHASALASSSSSAAGLGLRPSRPAFFFSRSR
jgi:anaerobic selenocysteine-containing dehydrogenase